VRIETTQWAATPALAYLATARGRWLIALAYFALLVGLSGPARIVTPSRAPHYTYLARAWLQGRLDLGEDPPGFAKHQHDDWARVITVELADGRQVEGRPCLTAACADRLAGLRRETRRRHEAILPLASDAPVYLATHEVSARSRSWYVSFPPAPAVLLLPFTAVLGLATPDRLVTLLLAALVPWLLLRLLARQRTGDPRAAATPGELWLAAATSLASPVIVVAANPSVWFTAQITCVVATLVYVDACVDLRRPGLAGGALAFAMASRPHVALAALLFAWIAVKRRAGLGAWSRFLAPLVVVGGILAWHNVVRFHDPLEFGHAYLDIRWQRRMQEIGLFSITYLPRNLACLLLLPPVFVPRSPFLLASVHGIALTFTTPWLATALLRAPTTTGASEALAPPPQRRDALPVAALLATAALVAIPNLLYQNSGQVQFTYRFALDWMIFLIPVLASSSWPRTWVFRGLVTIGAALCLHGAYWTSAAPMRSFVLDPLGWPFESELREP
jgi:hypothetical protein